MRIIEQSHEIMDPFRPGVANEVASRRLQHRLEICGRTCYQSEPPEGTGEESTRAFLARIIKQGHESVLEHEKITVRFITDRGVTHELVRHRIASFSQESTRYCDYDKEDIEFIRPVDFRDDVEQVCWEDAMREAEAHYKTLRNFHGCSPQLARSVLPNSLKTAIVVTANIREWRHILRLRTAKGAHPQMRALMMPLLLEFWNLMPVLFEDIYLMRREDKF